MDDLLLLARAERSDFLRPEWIDLSRFVTDLWDGVSLTADQRFELGEVPSSVLRADPDRLAQALRNLAGNAVGHTPQGLASCACKWSGQAVTGCALSCSTTDQAFRPTSVSAYSSAFTASTPSARDETAGPDWGWRSCGRSPRLMGPGARHRGRE